MMTLYGYFRSSTSYRTRIAMNLKQLDYDYIAVNLAKDEQLEAVFQSINPQGLVPVVQINDLWLYQSPAILEWLEEVYPEHPLLPKDAAGRMQVRALSAMIGCDIHPLNNRRILQYLRNELSVDEDQVMAWCHRWMSEGFDALEKRLAQDKTRGKFCYGDSPTFADCYLIPQVSSAERFKVDLSAYPNIVAIDAHCRTLKAFADADPMVQPDAPNA
ncbi:maleylpyruvate isomerase [Psychrobacter cryohalolentis K5]|uniref:Maleylpyruvate isomerase n=2 Tax=Moraxellaceae TaxID=468 RepID=Q1QAG5_PSYCK|nr:maleylpyruvate isomerase [Psychrobacter cryohalolentis K5]ASE25530.1 maleylacetoacetate isomerase [Psychrobacter cryohalolentis]KAA0934826.1 maleylacetoacetate isomerase [Psychrobacter sp. ANT_H59]MBA2057395.1 maleylacetoacetate isomerase [Psychrobacter sp. D2]